LWSGWTARPDVIASDNPARAAAPLTTPKPTASPQEPAAPIAPSPWDGLRKGLAEVEVRALLGEPHRVQVFSRLVIGWEYRAANGEGAVSLLNGRLQEWKPLSGPFVPASAPPQALSAWRKLAVGMTTDQVRALIGTPTDVSLFTSTIVDWTYRTSSGVGKLTLVDNLLQQWEEPPPW
jgi:hypothetical protein